MGLLKRFLGEKGAEEAGTQAATQDVELTHLTAGDFDELIKAEMPAVVDFWAEWCGPCHMISPSVQKLANEFAGRARIAKLNADEFPEILGRYGIMGIPTLIYFKGGKEVDRVVGVTGYGTLKGKLERQLG